MAYIDSQHIKNGSITEADLDAALAAKINAAGSSDVVEGTIPGYAANAESADYATSAGSAGDADTLTGVLSSDLGGAGTVNGIMKANGSGVVSAAVAGTDYLTPTGNGSGLTNLNADNLAAGTVADGRLSANVPLLNAANTYTATQTALEYRQTPKPVNTTGYVTFMFDDGRETDYTMALPLFQSKGIVGVSSVIADLVGTAGYMTASQIQALSAAGWEIASHSKSHLDFDDASGLSEAQMRAQMSEGKAAITALGIPCNTMVFPHNVSNALARRLAREYFRGARGGDTGANPSVLNTYRLNQYNIDDSNYQVNQKAVIAAAAAEGAWIICYAHSIDSADVANIGELIDYALSLGMTPVTLSGGLDAIGNAMDMGDKAAIGEFGLRGDGTQLDNVAILNRSNDFKPSANATWTLRVRTSNGTNVLTADTLNQRIGVGPATPTSLLDVNAPTDGNLARFRSYGGVNDPAIWLGVSDTDRLATVTATGAHVPDLSFNVGSVEAMRIKYSTGRIGIGTTAPEGMVHIQNTTPTTGKTTVLIKAGAGDSLSSDKVFAVTNNVGNADFLKVQGNGYVNLSAGLFTPAVVNPTSSTNASISMATSGTQVSRNVADANPALTVTQTNASSTGDIAQFKNNSGVVASVSQAGKATFPTLNLGNLAVYADNAAAIAGGLAAGDLYRTATGVLMVTYTP